MGVVMSKPLPTSGQEGKNALPVPPIGETVLVQFENFRCMAFRDKDGKWRDCFHKEELHGTIRSIFRLF